MFFFCSEIQDYVVNIDILELTFFKDFNITTLQVKTLSLFTLFSLRYRYLYLVKKYVWWWEVR